MKILKIKRKKFLIYMSISLDMNFIELIKEQKSLSLVLIYSIQIKQQEPNRSNTDTHKT